MRVTESDLSSRLSPRVFESAAATVLERTIEICQVVSPTGSEGAAREVLARWWDEDGVAGIEVDEVGNLWGRFGSGRAPLALAAHLDTVFGPEVTPGATRVGGRLVGPGVGDDRVALAALSIVASLVTRVDPERPVVLIATVGEEGLGNLRGSLHATSEPRHPFSALVALEGNYLDRVVNVAVGSVRWRVTFRGPGGHAWEAAGHPSAVHAAARAVAAIDEIAIAPGLESLNVGLLRGGEAINARAQEASFDLDVRAASADALESLVERCANALEVARRDGLAVEVTEIGRRPAGSLEASHPLVRTAWRALESVGRTPRLSASSTDANAAHSRGIPAVALGVTVGEGEHTPGEWIEVSPVATGLEALVRTIVDYEEDQ